MIYLDSSVAIAELLAEDRRPPEGLWDDDLISSRLFEYEVWVRLHARGLGEINAEPARQLVRRVSLLELSPVVLVRALEPFPRSLRTLDALHIASMAHLRDNGERVALASYDHRMTTVAETMGFPLYDLGN